MSPVEDEEWFEGPLGLCDRRQSSPEAQAAPELPHDVPELSLGLRVQNTIGAEV